jgi:cystathionine beta-synthase
MREYDVSQLPVVKAEPPLAFAEVVGSVRERTLLDKVFQDPTLVDRTVADVMDPPLPGVGAGEPIDVAVAALEGVPAVLVVDAGHPVGIVTRSDLLDFLAKRS